MDASEHSLYKIIKVDTEKSLIVVKDLLNDKDNINLIDVSLSKSVNEDLLVYTRLLNFAEFSITSGLGFIFSSNHKDFLMKRSRKLMKKIKSDSDSIRRFIAFFMLNRTDGRPILFERIDKK